MKSYLILDDGEKIYIDQISNQYPFSMLLSEEILFTVSKFIAEKIYFIPVDSLEYKVTVNFLCQRSKKVKNITAIILLSKKLKIKELCVEYINSLFSIFFEGEINIKDFPIKRNYLDKTLLLSSLVKYFPNLFFLLAHCLFFKKSSFQKTVIRAWVDVDEKLHKSVIQNSTIFIYPFGINLSRSTRFIKHCFTKYNSVTLMGVPYSFTLYLKAILQFLGGADIGIINYEISAMKKHAHHFEKFEKIFTSDEYIPAIYTLYNSLNPNIVVINNCHGIGVYNRYINYRHMIVFNKFQKAFYKLANPNVTYEIKIKGIDKLTTYKADKFNKKPVYIYLDQGDLRVHNFFYEFKIQEKLLYELNKLSQLYIGSIFIKYHPNRDKKSKINLLKKYNNLKPVVNMDNLKDKKLVFINLYSTAYYDFRNLGTVLFIKDDLFTAKKLFGKDISTIQINDLEKIITQN